MRVCEEAAEEAREVADAGCLLLLYFSGHGALQTTPSGNDVVMFTGDVGAFRSYPLSVAFDALWDTDGTKAGDHCVLAFMDCCQVPATHLPDSGADADAQTFASCVLCACPPGEVTPASWAGSFSPYVHRCLLCCGLVSLPRSPLVHRV